MRNATGSFNAIRVAKSIAAIPSVTSAANRAVSMSIVAAAATNTRPIWLMESATNAAESATGSSNAINVDISTTSKGPAINADPDATTTNAAMISATNTAMFILTLSAKNAAQRAISCPRWISAIPARKEITLKRK